MIFKAALYSLTAIFLIISSGCSIAPKADYTRTHINRPYTLPKDVAKVRFGARYLNVTEDLIDPSKKSTSEDEFQDGGVVPALHFENGITDKFSWIYPIGAKYTFLNNDKHSIGVSAFTLFVYSNFSIDHWYRLSEKTSLRSSFNGSVTNYFIFFTQKFWGPKLEIIQQFTDHFAASFALSYERASFESEFFNTLFGDDAINALYRGGTVEASTLYSINDRWDLISKIQYSKYEPQKNSSYDLEILSAMFGANYYW